MPADSGIWPRHAKTTPKPSPASTPSRSGVGRTGGGSDGSGSAADTGWSATRETTYAGIPLLISWASSTKRKG